MIKGKDIERFWSKVNKNGDCWEWDSCMRSGYGAFKLNGKSVSAHRISWIMANGDIPDGMGILHKCNNRCCVNPAHLYVGTQKDNVRDAIAIGAHKMFTAVDAIKAYRSRPIGSRVGPSKLTENDVRKIRTLRDGGLTYRKIAGFYGIDHTTVISLIKGETWGHVV